MVVFCILGKMIGGARSNFDAISSADVYKMLYKWAIFCMLVDRFTTNLI